MRVIIALAAVLLFPLRTEAQGEKRVAEIPKGLPMEIRLETTLDSRTTAVGHPVRASLVSPITVNGTVIVPSGAELSGKVTDVSGPQMGVMKAKINFVFTEIKTRSGTIPIQASAHLDVKDLATKGGKMAGQAAAKEVAKRAIPVFGTVFLIQDVAKGVQFVTEEKEITIPAGTRMKVHLDKDMRIPTR